MSNGDASIGVPDSSPESASARCIGPNAASYLRSAQLRLDYRGLRLIYGFEGIRRPSPEFRNGATIAVALPGLSGVTGSMP